MATPTTWVNHHVAYDGNGNVVALADATAGAWSARYEYGPFGETLRASGSMAVTNPVRWSTKVTDDDSGLSYYGFRYYFPSVGRWLSRDPLGEKAGLNLFSIVSNDSVLKIDTDGRFSFVWPVLSALAELAAWWIENHNINADVEEMRGSMLHDIYVNKCEIVVVYGHGSRENPLRWHVAPSGCSAGGSVTC
jgi:RHS repeat-associated protein